MKWAEQQRVLERSKRDVMPGEVELVQQSVTSLRRDSAVRISDPFFKDQWYLVSWPVNQVISCKLYCKLSFSLGGGGGGGGGGS